MFERLHRSEKLRPISYAVGGLLGPVFNTLFFMSCIVLFFWNTEFIQGMAATMAPPIP